MTADRCREASERLAGILELRELGTDRLVAAPLVTTRARLFGGQVAAQALTAAATTVDPDSVVNALHAMFLRPGDPGQSVEFRVTRLRDGRSFSSRRVEAMQAGRCILHSTQSFHRPESGPSHGPPRPEVRGPEALPDIRELLASVDGLRGRVWDELPFLDIRVQHVAPDGGPGGDPDEPGRLLTWFRVNAPMGDDPIEHAALVALVADLQVLASALDVHGLRMHDAPLRTASLDHAVWFHRVARADKWLLLTTSSPTADHGRALGTGQMFDDQGELVATIVQEGLVRPD